MATVVDLHVIRMWSQPSDMPDPYNYDFEAYNFHPLVAVALRQTLLGPYPLTRVAPAPRALTSVARHPSAPGTV
jgi:hypothetical protein